MRTALFFLLVVAAAANFAGVHLILNCGSYWGEVSKAGQDTIEFDTVTCASDAVAVGKSVDTILMRPGRHLIIANSKVDGGGWGGESEQHLVRALNAGGTRVAIFFIERSPDMEANGLDPAEVLMVTLAPDNRRGAVQTGNELCRRAGTADQNVAVIYGNAFDERIDAALEQFKRCAPASKSALNISCALTGKRRLQSLLAFPFSWSIPPSLLLSLPMTVWQRVS